MQCSKGQTIIYMICFYCVLWCTSSSLRNFLHCGAPVSHGKNCCVFITYVYEKHGRCLKNAGTTWYSWHSKYVYYLVNHLKIDNGGRLTTKLDHKRDDFIYGIVSFPFISSNIPAAPAYVIYISQHLCYFRACVKYSYFLDSARSLTQNVLLIQGYVAPRWLK